MTSARRPEGVGAPGAEIPLLDGDALAAHAVADADGGFALDVPDSPGLRLIARFRQPAAGLALGSPSPDGDVVVLRLEDVAPVSPVVSTDTGTAG